MLLACLLQFHKPVGVRSACISQSFSTARTVQFSAFWTAWAVQISTKLDSPGYPKLDSPGYPKLDSPGCPNAALELNCFGRNFAHELDKLGCTVPACCASLVWLHCSVTWSQVGVLDSPNHPCPKTLRWSGSNPSQNTTDYFQACLLLFSGQCLSQRRPFVCPCVTISDCLVGQSDFVMTWHISVTRYPVWQDTGDMGVWVA
jgi:hypothetical protein